MGALNRCCLARKVISKEVTAGGRLDFFLDFVLRELMKKSR